MRLDARLVNRFKPVILVLMAIFFAQKLYSGTLFYYIGPRFSWLVLVAAAVLIALAGSFNLARGNDTHDHDADHTHVHGRSTASLWPLAVVALPLALGVLVPARPLGAGAATNRGISTDYAVSADERGTLLSVAPSSRTVLDWARAMSANPDPTALDGQQADVVGFVYRDPRFASDQFMVARFAITCCVADATAIGVVVQSADAAGLAVNSWVRVTGGFEAGRLAGAGLPVLIAADVTPVHPLEQPYLYP
jgi:putative membrane protein